MLKNALAVMILVVYCFTFGIVTKWFLAKDDSSKVTNGENYIDSLSYDFSENTDDYKEEMIENSAINESVENNIEDIEVSSRSGNRYEEVLNYEIEDNNELILDNYVEDENGIENVEIDNSEEVIPLLYQGFEVAGRIEIPKTGVNLYILKKINANGMEIACCIYYSKGEFNKNGIHLIGGHNYENGRLFSNNDLLDIGDKFYITTIDGERVEYTIFNKFVTASSDVSYLKGDYSDSSIMCLQCCTNIDDGVIIIQGCSN